MDLDHDELKEECLITPVSGDQAARAEDIARRWGLEISQPGRKAGLRLLVDEEGVWLGDTRPGAPGPIRVDYLAPALLRRMKQVGAAKEGLARAVGARRGHRPTVIDATAGLGQDSAVLAALGCEVMMVERSPVLAALLEDGLRRAREDERTKAIVARLTLIRAESAAYLSGLPLAERPEVVYMDPMFAPRRKGGLSGRSMQHLQRLLGHGEDHHDLLEAALAAASRRVVVKRRRKAEGLPGRAPDLTIPGTSTRFDVYLRHDANSSYPSA